MWSMSLSRAASCGKSVSQNSSMQVLRVNLASMASEMSLRTGWSWQHELPIIQISVFIFQITTTQQQQPSAALQQRRDTHGLSMLWWCYVAEIQSMKQSSLSWLLLLVVVGVSSYDIVGAWQLVAVPGRYESLTATLTFQFAKNADASGTITTKLFVYDCFLSQFLYDAEEDMLALSFQTSSLLTAECSLAPINELRALAQKVFFFQVLLDRLLLLSLNGETVFELLRQKFDYSKIMAGVWTMTASSSAAYPARINGTAISICADQAQLAYSVATINGSYPRLTLTNVFPPGNCADQSFLSGLQATRFLRVAENLTQLTLFDASGNYLMALDKVGSIQANQPLTTSTSRQSPSSLQTAPSGQPQTQSSSNIATSTTVVQSSISTQTPTSYAPGPIQPNTQVVIQQIAISQPQSQPSQPKQPQHAIQSQPSQTLQTQSQQAIQTQSQPQTQQAIQTIAPQQTQSATPPSTAYAPSQSTSSASTSNPSSFTWVFNQNDIFSGSFSSAPLFSYDPSPNNNQPQSYQVSQDTQPNQVTASPPIAQVQANPPQASTVSYSTQGATQFQLSDAFFSDLGATAFAQQQPAYTPAPPTPAPTPSPSSSAANAISTAATVSVSQLISKSMSGGELQIGEFVVLNKWLLVWLNGVSSLQRLGVVYVIFTTSKIILYCPCNTYYTNYMLQGNALRGISWKGTSNQCEINNDRRVTDYIFYATAVRQRGKNLAFFYNSQAALAEFQPYY